MTLPHYYARNRARILSQHKAKFDTDRGRVLESTTQTFSVGENYQTTLRGATLSCFITYDVDDSTAGAYASQVVGSPVGPADGIHPLDRDLNLTMFLDADVVELPSTGAYFVPRQRCFDLNLQDEGMTAFGSLQDTIPVWTTERYERPVSLGSRTDTLVGQVSRLTRIIRPKQETPTSLGFDIVNLPEDTNDDLRAWEVFLILSAYRTPHPGLWALWKSGAVRSDGTGKSL